MKWFIPGNVPSSKNSRRWTGKFFIASKTVMKYRKETANVYKKLAVLALLLRNLLSINYLCHVHFYVHIEGPVTSLITLTLHKQCKMIWLNMGGWKMITVIFIIPCFETSMNTIKKEPGVIIELKDEKNKRKD